MTGRRLFFATPCVVVLAIMIAWELSCPPAARCGEAEVIRGTVDRVRSGILYLTDVRLHDSETPGKAVMVIVTKDTDYFDGPMKVTKESITKGLKVIVRCEPAGTGRIAVLVRIVGGKTP